VKCHFKLFSGSFSSQKILKNTFYYQFSPVTTYVYTVAARSQAGLAYLTYFKNGFKSPKSS